MRDQVLNFNLHTLIMTVGPSGCGKSYFCENVLIPQLKSRLKAIPQEHINVQYISSDAIRRELLGQPDLHKHDSRMMHSSREAFKVLHAKIEAAMQWPVAAQFVVVDTTGLNHNFRKALVDQAHRNNYRTDCVVFDYKQVDEYMEFNRDDPKFSRRVVMDHLKRLRTDFYKTLTSKSYNTVHKIRNNKFFKSTVTVEGEDTDQLTSGCHGENVYCIEIPDLGYYAGCFLDPEKKYDIVGDVHGHWNELYKLLTDLGYKFENAPSAEKVHLGNLYHPDPDRRVILVGDLIDKGPYSKKILQFVDKNFGKVHVALGNHEHFVHNYLKGDIRLTGMTTNERKEFFDCTESFRDDEEAKDLLTSLVESHAKVFLRHPNFIVTHAPTENKYLEKVNTFGAKMQRKGKNLHEIRKLPIKERIAAQEEALSHIRDEAINNAPNHIFGHTAYKRVLHIRNKICVDTGCAQGGRLTSVTFAFGKMQETYVDCIDKPQDCEELFDIFRKKGINLDYDLSLLEPRELGRCKWAARSKVNYISGTVSPAASDVKNNKLEPLDKAFEYYKRNDITRLIMEPKYMGSRCNLYINRDINECYAVSRNGYLIERCDLTKIFEEKIKEMPEDAEWIIFDCELMPWSALGQGLIDETYKVVAQAVESELGLLTETGFEDALNALTESEEFDEFMVDRNNMPKKDLISKFGQRKQENFRELADYNHHSLAKHYEALGVYKEQIEIFGSTGEPSVKPFAVLKVIKKDGSEVCLNESSSNLLMFEGINSDEFSLVDLNDDQSVQKAHKFFEDLTDNKKMEGVVIKPADITYQKDVAPYMKVRSEAYLHITYGYDYKFAEKYERLVKSKSVGRKISASIREFEIGLEMLKIARKDIDENNDKYLKLLANMIREAKHGQYIDPRL